MTPTILVFLKAPQMGEVKTRLTRSIGTEAALKVYRALVERQLRKLAKFDRLEIHYAPKSCLEQMREWLGRNYIMRPQCEGNLGERLENAVTDSFKRGADPVICIGGDCPNLDKIHIDQATAALGNDYDVVFGPSEDGGYYLMGLNAPHPKLFQNVPWSSTNTLEVSLQHATNMKLRVRQLETLYDVDDNETLYKAFREGFSI